MTTQQLQRLFNETTLGDLMFFKANCSPAELAVVNLETSLSSCLKTFLEKKISALPVMDSHGKVIAIVDMLDVIRFVTQKLEAQEEEQRSEPLSDWIAEVCVKNVINFAEGDPLLVSNSQSPVANILKFFASGLAHRCVVRFEQESVYGIISQVDIAYWLASKVNDDVELRQSLSEISLMSELKNRSTENHKIVSAMCSDSVLDIMNLLLKEKVQAVALVDEQGKLQGNFSAFDLAHLEKASIDDLRLSGREYLQKFSKWSLTPLVILQSETSSLAESLFAFAGMGVHRIWLVDSPVDQKFSPSGVVTATDVLRVVHNHYLSV